MYTYIRLHKSQIMNIKKKIVRVLVSLLLLTSTVASASPNFKNTFDWQPVIDAIIQVESNGNPKAKSGNSVGAMQITPILVAQCNIILKEKARKDIHWLTDTVLQNLRRCFCLCNLSTIPRITLRRP